jgi:hypothetical protein
MVTGATRTPVSSSVRPPDHQMGPACPWRGAHRPLRKPLRRCRDRDRVRRDFTPVSMPPMKSTGHSRFAPTGDPSTATPSGSPAATPSTRLGGFANLASTEQQGGGTTSADRRRVLCRVGSVIAPTVVAISRSVRGGSAVDHPRCGVARNGRAVTTTSDPVVAGEREWRVTPRQTAPWASSGTTTKVGHGPE